jgi:ER degradation enhancer, mannosidase alpha-like 1
MGGLLSCHSMATLKKFNMNVTYDNHCLHLARKLGDALLPAFVNVLPYAHINLALGLEASPSPFSCASGVGSLLLEFGTLSRLTRNASYENAARKALDKLWSMRSEKNLVAQYLDIEKGEWTNAMTGIGGGVDSMYEYMAKGYVLFGDGALMDSFVDGYAAVENYVKQGILYGTSNINGANLNAVVESLSAFWPGLQVLVGDLESAKRYHQYLFTLWRKFGLLPDGFDSRTRSTTDPNYPLRPELFESTYFLYQATKNHYYLEVGASLLRDIEMMRVKCGIV